MKYQAELTSNQFAKHQPNGCIGKLLLSRFDVELIKTSSDDWRTYIDLKRKLEKIMEANIYASIKYNASTQKCYQIVQFFSNKKVI